MGCITVFPLVIDVLGGVVPDGRVSGSVNSACRQRDNQSHPASQSLDPSFPRLVHSTTLISPCLFPHLSSPPIHPSSTTQLPTWRPWTLTSPSTRSVHGNSTAPPTRADAASQFFATHLLVAPSTSISLHPTRNPHAIASLSQPSRAVSPTDDRRQAPWPSRWSWS